MKTTLLVLGLTFALAYSSVIQINGEKKKADTSFLKRQKQVLDLFVGIGHSEYFHNEWADYDIEDNLDNFNDHSIVRNFLEVYKQGFLPVDGVFSWSSPDVRKQTILLFDVFFFARDFDTFYRTACWAKRHVQPIQFAYAYFHALVHREDCYNFVLPPLYEVFPTYFVPQDVFHKIYDAKMYGLKEEKFSYNNTGYEYNYHGIVQGSPVAGNAYPTDLEYKISYLMEDVGFNSFYAMWNVRYPSWMCPMKYKKSHWIKRGEGFYYTHQQIYARYVLERIANGLPFVEQLYWDKPVKTGYNPRIGHFNGYPYYVRPDNVVPVQANEYYVKKAQVYENRLYEAIDQGAFWYNNTVVPINNEDGIDILGKAIYSTVGVPYKNYFGDYHHSSLEALAYLVQTGNDKYFLGGATRASISALRDPAFYMYLNRLMSMFQWHKKNVHQYTKNDLFFPGVNVIDFEVDKLVTYFDKFDYEVTNALPVHDYKEYSNLKYYVSQNRLNHKPFTYKVVVNSDKVIDGMVRIFIGPKYDSEYHLLTVQQKRLFMVEIDRFPVKLNSGHNVFERNSKESPIFAWDSIGFRQLYNKINSAINTQETYYIDEKVTCGVPQRILLPQGSKNGQQYSVVIVVSQFDKKYGGEPKDFYATCGSSKLYDYRPFGYPFDRPVQYSGDYVVPNIYFKDVTIYHREEYDINRSDQTVY